MRDFVAFLVVLMSCAAAFGEDNPRRSISTQGEATVYVVPDQVEISVAVETFSNKLDEAKSANDKSAESAVAAIKAVGVEPKQISTSDVTVTIDYEPNRMHHEIAGSTVRRAYVIKVTDVSLVSKVVDAALSNGANEISGVTFSSTQMRKYRDQARKMAAKAAREKASDLADELGAAIGPVRTINESLGTWGNYWGYNRYSGFGNTAQNAVSQGAGDDAGPGGDGTTPPGQIAIRASVAATFDLQDAPHPDVKSTDPQK
jgi:uncharacterized protein